VTKGKAGGPVAQGPSQLQLQGNVRCPLATGVSTGWLKETLFPCWLEPNSVAFAYSQPKGASVFYQVFIDTFHHVLKCHSIWPVPCLVAVNWHFLTNILHWIELWKPGKGRRCHSRVLDHHSFREFLFCYIRCSSFKFCNLKDRVLN